MNAELRPYQRMLERLAHTTRREAQRRGGKATAGASTGVDARTSTIPRPDSMEALDERHDWDKATSPLTRRG